MRGARVVSKATDTLERIIPADAGSTKTVLLPYNCYRDHPHGCGEHRQERSRRV